MTDLFDIAEEEREAIVRQLEEWGELRRSQEIETKALLSADEVDQLNAAVDVVADKLGFSGELATIDTLLRLRNTRIARVLSAAYVTEGLATDTV